MYEEENSASIQIRGAILDAVVLVVSDVGSGGGGWWIPTFHDTPTFRQFV